MTDTAQDISCPHCHNKVDVTWYYCPSCGTILKSKPFSVSLVKQISLYFISFFFSPLGLVWGIRYVRNPNRKTKIVGLIIIALTLISLGITIYTFTIVTKEYSRMLMNLGNGVYTPIFP